MFLAGVFYNRTHITLYNSLPFLARLPEAFEGLFIMDFGRCLCK